MKKTLLLFLFFSLTKCEAQSTIFLEEYSINIDPVKCIDTVEKKRGSKKIVLYIKNCMGEMYCEVYEKNILIEKGNYLNSLDTLTGYSVLVPRGNSEPPKIIVRKYFQPLRDGEWFFYDPRKKKVSKKYYDTGIEIKEE